MKKLIGVVISLVMLCSAVTATPLPVQGESVEIGRYGKDSITDPNVAYVYELLVNKLAGGLTPAAIEFPAEKEIRTEHLEKAFALFISDYPECFWVRKNYNYAISGDVVMKLTPDYAFTGAELAEARAAMERTVEEILAGLPGTSNYDKTLYLHDELANHVTYEQVGEHQTAYGALVAGRAVCAGYAAAYQLLLNRAGIRAWTVAGYSSRPGEETPIPHAWNVVWLEDDVCVYTDVTWDDGQNGLFHYYLNISQSEMAQDHTVAEGQPDLPACDHDTYGYFDRNGLCVDDNTTIEELAAMFGPAEGGARKAIFCYEGADLEAFLDKISDRQMDLYEALSCGPGSCGYGLSMMTGEIHMTVEGNFPAMTYLVEVRHDNTIKIYGEAGRYVEMGQAMTPMRVMAENGYYFPADYAVVAVSGVRVTRVSAGELLVEGTPTEDVTITLPAASEVRKETTPHATFSLTGKESGRLTVDTEGAVYSFDGVHWQAIPAGGEVELAGITVEKLYVKKAGNGEGTVDSDIQVLIVPVRLEETTVPPTSDTKDPVQSQKPADPGNSGGSISFGCSMTMQSCAVVLCALLAAWGLARKKKD